MTPNSPNLDQIRAMLREYGYVIVSASALKAAIANLGGGTPERAVKATLQAALSTK